MRFFRYTRGEERHFLDSSFEPSGDGYAYYRHHLARGIPVTAEEREACLRPPLDGSRREFHEAIRGRPASLPRRSWRRSQQATLAAIPAGFGLGLVLVGASLVWRGPGFEPPLSWLLIGAGIAGAAYGLLVLAVRRPPGSAKGSNRPSCQTEPLAKTFDCRRFE
jgi:hypothetical protein